MSKLPDPRMQNKPILQNALEFKGKRHWNQKKFADAK